MAFNSPDKAAQLGHFREGWSQIADLGAGPGVSGAEWGIQSYRIVLPALQKHKTTTGTGMGGAAGDPTPST